MFCTFTLALPAVCVQCPIRLFAAVAQCRALPVCCSGTVRVILKRSHLPLLLLVLRLVLHSICATFYMRCVSVVKFLYIKRFGLLS